MFLHKNKIKDQFPFVSVITGNGTEIEYCGVVLAANRNTITFIDIDKIKDKDTLYRFILLCQQWWWYSNRLIPINLYYYDDTIEFMKYVTHLPTKTHTIVSGYITSLDKIVDHNKSSIKNRTLKTLD